MAIGVPIRAEQWRLAWCEESSYGVDPSTAGTGYTGFFGVVQEATLPDVQTDFQPFYGMGTESKRNWYVMYRGRQSMAGSISNFLLLDGKCLYLALGGTSAAPAEANTLPSFSLHAGYVNATGGVALRRRFHGGKVNRMTLSANEGGFLTCSIDEMLFSAFTHNATAGPTASYAAVTDIPAASAIYTCDQPWLFSGGTLSLWGTDFARVRNFRLSVGNACQPKYYITDDGADQLPYEIREGKRDYSMSCTIDIEDSSIYAELLNQGCTGAGTGNMVGFTTRISFVRPDGDTISITSPAGATGNYGVCGGDSQGCFIRSAPHNINTGDNLLGVPITIMLRSVGISVPS
jgi:hypothetical protein